MTYEWQLPDRSLRIGRMPLIMGIVNVTPDSFSDGGCHATTPEAIEYGLALVEQGADILDIGGESTRPGAGSVAIEEELRRVLPVVEGIAGRTKVPLSIDTSKAEVARRACGAGASIINDVTALTGDPGMVLAAQETGAAIVAMHMQGTPLTMQQNPHYEDVVKEVQKYLELRLLELQKTGIAPQRIALDPGIGFGKRQDHNLQLLGHLDRLTGLGRPLCLGVSRKGFINRILGRTGHAEHGDSGTVGVLTYALARGWVQIARVHNVKAFHDTARLFLALERAAQGIYDEA